MDFPVFRLFHQGSSGILEFLALVAVSWRYLLLLFQVCVVKVNIREIRAIRGSLLNRTFTTDVSDGTDEERERFFQVAEI
jgi:hypothetical protein